MVGSVMVAYETVPLKARVRSPADQFFQFFSISSKEVNKLSLIKKNRGLIQ